MVQLAQKVRGLAPEHEKEQEVFIKEAVFIKKEMFSIEELCEEEFSKEVSSKKMYIKEEVIQEEIMKEEVIQEEILVYKEMCTDASLDSSSQSPSLRYVPEFTRPRSTVYSASGTPTPPRVGTTSNDTAIQEEQKVASEDPRVAGDQEEVTSDQKEVASDQEKITSQLLEEMRTYQDMTQEVTQSLFMKGNIISFVCIL